MDEISEPRNARSRRTRSALLDAARALLEEEGFEALTIPAVAARAGVSRRGAYLHFRTRADLVQRLFAHVAASADLAGSLRPVWEAPDGVTALAEWARHLARYHPRLLAVDRAIQRVRDRDADAAAHHERVQRLQHGSCLRLARWLEAEGELASPWTPESAADMLWAQVSSEVIGGLVEDCGWSPTALAEHLVAMYLATFTVSGHGTFTVSGHGTAPPRV